MTDPQNTMTTEERAAHARDVSNAAMRTPYSPTPRPEGALFRWVVPNLGGFVALLLLPVVLVSNITIWGWVIAVGAWLLNRIGHEITGLLVNGLPQTMAVGAAGFGMMLRVWFIAFILFFVGADMKVGEAHIGFGNREAAISGMFLFLIPFTIDIAVRAALEFRRFKVEPTEGTSV